MAVSTSNVGSAKFNNDMRVGVGGITGDNKQFFKFSTNLKKNDFN